MKRSERTSRVIGGGLAASSSVRWSVVMASAVAVSSCFFPTEPAAKLDLTIEVTPSVFAIGDTTTVKFVVKNPTHDVIEFWSGVCGFRFEVVDMAGSVVSPGGIVCAAPSVLHSVAPGDSITPEWKWIGEVVCSEIPCELLPPGRYLVAGRLRTSELVRHSEPVFVELLAGASDTVSGPTGA